MNKYGLSFLLAGLFLTACTSKSSESVSSMSSASLAASTQVASGADKGAAASELPEALKAPADVSAVPENAEKTPSGLASKVLHAASTPSNKPQLEDTVEVHYTGWTSDGKMFDSSVMRGQTARFPLNRVIAGWAEGLQLMQIGEKRRLWIPEALAYGSNPPSGAPVGMLVFDVELKSVIPAPKPIAAPEDVAKVPADAKVTASHLAYKVLQKGKGSRHPLATSHVEVHYTGWTTNGKMFDSSVLRGQTATFPLNGVIRGWTEGLQLMVEGEKVRFWIPKDLAYNDAPGMPQGMLVFDVELIAIQ